MKPIEEQLEAIEKNIRDFMGQVGNLKELARRKLNRDPQRPR